MKRKFLILLLASVCVFCLAFAISACNKTHANDDNNGNITDGDNGNQDDIDYGNLIGHVWTEWDIVIPATCEEKGKISRSCTNDGCNAIQVRSIDPLGHEITDALTEFYSHDGLCNRCQTQISKKHIFNTLNVCTECGYEIIPSEGLKYTEQKTYYGVEYYVSQGDFWGTDLVIPYYYNQKPVTTIADGAFYKCVTLKTAHIPDSVTSIGTNAFKSCILLESVEISDNVETISVFAFQDCKNLVQINLPAKLTKIEDFLFDGCAKITKIVIPEGVETIDAFVFGSTAITSINIPASVTYIDNYAFDWATKLESITVSENNTKYASQDGIVYNKAKTVITNVPEAIKGVITLSDNLTVIERSAFYYCESLEGVIIPDSVAYIDYNAFCNCTNLKSVTMGDGVIEIGDDAFDSCNNLTEINLSNKLTKIGSSAFGRTNITSIVIPASVTYIGINAFWSCDSLKSMTFENPVGWWYANSLSATTGTSIPASELSNPATAAAKMTDVWSYGGNYLHCN